MVQVLLNHGANPLVRNVRGRRPIDVATRTKIKKLLRSNVIHSDSEEGDDEEEDDIQIMDAATNESSFITVDLTGSPVEEFNVITPKCERVDKLCSDDDMHSSKTKLKGLLVIIHFDSVLFFTLNQF